ncbi:MAG: flavin monoamine oxidase family protein [Candidatus Sericytochromatia bacterium]
MSSPASQAPMGSAQPLESPTPEVPEAPTTSQHDIVVIGAGVSGMKAAQELSGKNLNVVVLEAQNKIGGRTRTDRSLGVAFDEGASWIHGSTGEHPITQLVAGAGLKSFSTFSDQVKVYDAEGKVISKAVFEPLYAQYKEALKMVRESGELQKNFQEVYASQVFPDLNAQPRLRDYMFTAFLGFNAGGDISKLSSVQFEDDQQFAGTEELITNGYDKIPQFLMESGKVNVRLKQVVKEIDYSGEKIKITTANNSQFFASQVVVTVPLGVLKAGKIQFQPALPESHQEAIRRMGMGNVNKFLIKWADDIEPFWEEDLHYIGYTSAIPGLFNYFLNLKLVKGIEANALMTFAFGDQADASEKLSDSEIKAGVMKNLKAIYGDKIPEPQTILRTRWRANEYSYGAYSFAAAGSPSTDFDTLTQPVGQKLFFAGEHTSRNYRGTVHGAFFSGRDAAQKILAVR